MLDREAQNMRGIRDFETPHNPTRSLGETIVTDLSISDTSHIDPHQCQGDCAASRTSTPQTDVQKRCPDSGCMDAVSLIGEFVH